MSQLDAKALMKESLRTRLLRLGFNAYPAYWGTGARLTYLADDFREVRLKLPLTWRTRNLVGTLFGGSMFAALDPIYMVMLMHNLGRGYVVWDKAAIIRFLKPGRETLYARLRLPADEIDGICAELEMEASTERTYVAELTSREGAVYAVVDKTLHFRRKPSVLPMRARPLARPTFSGSNLAHSCDDQGYDSY